MKKSSRFLCGALCICLSVCLFGPFAKAQELTSQDEEIYQSISEIYSDPNATMLDFISVVNPAFCASITDEQRTAFDNMNYQELLNGANVGSTRDLSGYIFRANISFHSMSPILYYGLSFQTVTSSGGSIDIPCIYGTTTLTDSATGEIIAESSDAATNDDSLYILEHTRDVESGLYYTNTCTLYGIDPYSQAFGDVAQIEKCVPYYDN